MSDSNYAYEGSSSGVIPVTLGLAGAAGAAYGGWKYMQDPTAFKAAFNKGFDKVFPKGPPINEYPNNAARGAMSASSTGNQAAAQRRLRHLDKSVA